jgi:predicted Zn-dependent peptidase
VSREDAKKEPESIHTALVQYNRYGNDSFFLRMLPSDALTQLTREELYALIRGLLDYKHTVSYVGTLPLDQVQGIYEEYHPVTAALKDPPPYKYLKARTPESTEIYLTQKEMAQSHVRLEFGVQDYQEEDVPAVQLYNEYFGGGMGGIVFQELREARALAYSAAARYLPGSRVKDQDLLIGFIGSQADKTADSVEVFIQILDNLPNSPERFQFAKLAVENRYRISKLGFRDVIGAVRGWERLGLEPDPRRRRFEVVQKADLDMLFEFFSTHVKERPKLVSIVGDKSKIDMEKLKQFGAIQEVGVDQIFVP